MGIDLWLVKPDQVDKMDGCDPLYVPDFWAGSNRPARVNAQGELEEVAQTEAHISITYNYSAILRLVIPDFDGMCAMFSDKRAGDLIPVLELVVERCGWLEAVRLVQAQIPDDGRIDPQFFPAMADRAERDEVVECVTFGIAVRNDMVDIESSVFSTATAMPTFKSIATERGLAGYLPKLPVREMQGSLTPPIIPITGTRAVVLLAISSTGERIAASQADVADWLAGGLLPEGIITSDGAELFAVATRHEPAAARATIALAMNPLGVAITSMGAVFSPMVAALLKRPAALLTDAADVGSLLGHMPAFSLQLKTGLEYTRMWQSGNYWNATPGNVGYVCNILLSWCHLYPDAIFKAGC